MAFVKLDCNLITSTVWTENSDTRVVWIYLLVSADSNGVVRVTVPGIAIQCGLSVDVVRAALERFASPDPDSRTSKNEGRRIRIEREPQFEIHLLNYGRYRAKDHTAAARKRRQREREKRERVTRDSRDSHAASQRVTQAEAEANNNLVAPNEDSGATGTPPKATTRGAKRKKRQGNPDIPALVQFYEAEFARTRGCAPVVRHGSAEKSFQALLSGRTLDEAKAIVSDFLEDPPPFYKDKALANPEHVVNAANTILARRNGKWPAAAPAASVEDHAAICRARKDAGLLARGEP
jgi:hypothetical protein